MNERIEAYLKQHHCLDYFNSYGETVEDDHYFMYREEVEGLVELIVRECAKQCLNDDSIHILNHMGVKGVEENERIDELFGQALDQAVPETWTTLNPAQLSKLKTKFAELIVRECIKLCDQVDIVGADECIDNIRNHFGVEL